MSIQPPEGLLSLLRANLRRPEKKGRDEDLTPTARDLKQFRLRRIENIETAMKNLNLEIQRSRQPKSPCDTYISL